MNTQRLILAAISGVFTYGCVAAMLGTIMPTFKFSDAQNGTIALMQAIGLMVASISVGPLVDKFGKKPALIVSMLLISASLFALPSTGGVYGPVLACLFGLGFGGGILVTAANALASDINVEQRASTLNFLNLFFGVGTMATPLVGANLLGGNATVLCYLVAAVSAIALILNATTDIPGPKHENNLQASDAGSLLSRPALWLLALMLFVYVTCEVGIFNWEVKYLMEQGVDQGTATNILGFGFAGALTVGRLIVSKALKNTPPQTVTLGAAIMMAVTTFLMLQTTNPTVTIICLVLAGLAMAPVFPTTLAMVGDAFTRGTATAMGIVITAGWAGLALSSQIIGTLANSSGLRTALMVLPVAAVLMALANLALRGSMAKKAQVASAR
jgi:fucose permease